MPNANITVYLTDTEYLIYLNNKVELNQTARQHFKKALISKAHPTR